MSYFVHILTNRKNGTLYIGVTSHVAVGSTGRALVRSSRANRREKAMKEWKRAWKIELIESANPECRDFYAELNR